jgi:hypothetical protein
VGPDWHAVWGMLEPDKNAPSPFLYHLGFIVGLTEGDLSSWYSSQEVSSSSPNHAYFPLRINSAYRSPYGGARAAQTSGPTCPSGVAGPWLACSMGNVGT